MSNIRIACVSFPKKVKYEFVQRLTIDIVRSDHVSFIEFALGLKQDRRWAAFAASPNNEVDVTILFNRMSRLVRWL